MLKERVVLEWPQEAADNKIWSSTYSNSKEKVIIVGSDRLVSTIPSFETCNQQESCVIMLSTTFSANGFFEFLKVLKNMQQFGRSSAFASSWHMGAA